MVFWLRRVRCGKVEETNDALTKLRRLKQGTETGMYGERDMHSTPVVMAPDSLQIWMQ